MRLYVGKEKETGYFLSLLCSRYLSSQGSEPSAACGGVKRGERVAAVCEQRRRTAAKALTGHRNRSVTRQVLSAYMSLTSVFGMAAQVRAASGRCSEPACCAAVGVQRRRFSGKAHAALPQTGNRWTVHLFPLSHQSKKPRLSSRGFLCSRYLSSRAVARQVLSAYMSLTSVFGMGTGGPSSQSTRTLIDGF